MKKNTVFIIVLSIIIVILLNYIIFSTALKTSIVEFLKLPVLGSIIVALVSVITVYLTNSFNLKKVKLENSYQLHRTQIEREYQIFLEVNEKLFYLNTHMRLLRPEFERVPQNDEERKIYYEDKYKKVLEMYNEFSVSINKYSPFYDKTIYLELLDIRNLIHDEVTNFEIDIIYDLNRDNTNQKLNSYDLRREIIEKINLRIEKLNERIYKKITIL